MACMFYICQKFECAPFEFQYLMRIYQVCFHWVPRDPETLPNTQQNEACPVWSEEKLDVLQSPERTRPGLKLKVIIVSSTYKRSCQSSNSLNFPKLWLSLFLIFLTLAKVPPSFFSRRTTPRRRKFSFNNSSKSN